MQLVRKFAFASAAAALVLGAWTALVAGVTFVSSPGVSVAIFAPAGAALAATAAVDGRLVQVNDYVVVARFEDPGFVRKLYAAGAVLVIDARIVGGCTGLPLKQIAAN